MHKQPLRVEDASNEKGYRSSACEMQFVIQGMSQEHSFTEERAL